MNVWLIAIGDPLPSDGQNVRLLRMGLLAENLVKDGHKVTWWTSTFNHLEKKQRAPIDKTIIINDRYSIELLHGIPYSKNISFSRVINHKIISWKFRKYACLRQQPDIILCSMPIPELCREATFFARANNVPVVIDFRDLWPNAVFQLFPFWFTPVIRSFLYPMVRSIKYSCTNATAICGVSPYFVDHGLSLAGRDKSRIDKDFPLGYSLVNHTEREIIEAKEYWSNFNINSESDKFIVSYIGTLGKPVKDEILTLIKAAKYISKVNNEITFVICGDGDMLSLFKDSAGNCKNIIFTGWINSNQIKVLAQNSSLGIIPYPETEDFSNTIPNKAFEYMAYGLPIITSVRGVLGRVISDNGCGMTYRSQNYLDLSNVIMNLFNNPEKVTEMKQNAYSLYISSYHSDSIYKKMSRYLEDVVTEYKNKCN